MSETIDKDFLIKELTICFLPETTLSANELEIKIEKALSLYSVQRIKETLPSTGDGSTTKYLTEEFFKDKLAQGCSEKTLKQYLLAIQKLFVFLQKEINLATKEDIVKYMNFYRYNNIKGEQKPTTVKNRYLQLSSFFTWMFDNGYILSNPFQTVATPKAPIPIKKVLTDGEFEQMIIACEKHETGIKLARDLAIITFLIETGVRASELCNIKIGDVLWDQKKVNIYHGKGNKDRVVFFGERAKKRLLEYLSYRNYQDDDYLFECYYQKKPLTTAGLERLTKEIGKRSGVSRLHPHLFRTTFATNMINRGIAPSVLKQLMGHSDLKTLESYVQLSDQDIEKAIKGIL